MAEFNIQLSENEIEQLINGKTISIPANFNNGKTKINKINIMQSLAKDVAAPLINYENKVVSQTEINNIKLATQIMADEMSAHRNNTFKLGS